MGSEGLVAAIAAAYADLRGAIRAKLEQAPRDSELVMLALLVALASFVASLPAAIRQAQGLEEPDALVAVLSARLFGAVFLLPLFLLALAGVSHLVARLFGGTGTHYTARVALIWALVVALPLGLGSAAIGAIVLGISLGPAAQGIAGILSTCASLGFAWIWATFLTEAEGFAQPVRVFATILAISLAIVALPWIFSA
ncbi:YIP1 family protein [Oceanibium sediminis]|uniref:YIP1 family protein n=1 Tax=Oceanibium sediminis TaxID=2026339 RepID=UPI000DD49AA2|nr:YIP1 family protein [Oceanibium sediminis]